MAERKRITPGVRARDPLAESDQRRSMYGSGEGANEPGDRRLALTTSQVAGRLGVSLGTVRRWADRGHLRSYRTPGGQRRFSAEDLEQFVASLERRNGVSR